MQPLYMALFPLQASAFAYRLLVANYNFAIQYW